MWQNAQDVYLETRVLSAEPIELVRILYQAAIGAVEDARRHLAAGEIAARSKSISKAYQILVELSGSLDRQRGAQISQRLVELYDYMERRLIEANLQQNDAPLGEVRGLLATLAEAWEGIRPPDASAAPATSAAPDPYAAPAPYAVPGQYADPVESPWAQPLPQEPAAAYASQSWSL
jgi:flagellar protein FliS